jgi:hypothetical protein
VLARAVGRAARTTGETITGRAVVGVAVGPGAAAVPGRTTTRTAGAAGAATAWPVDVAVVAVEDRAALTPIATIIESAAPALRPSAATRLRAAA